MNLTKKPVLLILISATGLLVFLSILLWLSLRPIHPKTMNVMLTFLWAFIGPSWLVAALGDRLLGQDHASQGGVKR